MSNYRDKNIYDSKEIEAQEICDAMKEKVDWFDRSDVNVVVCFGVCLFFAGLFVALNWIWG